MRKLHFIASLAFVSLTAAGEGASIHLGLLNYWNFEGNFRDSAGGIAGNASTFADDGVADGFGNVVFSGSGPLGTHADFAASYISIANSADVLAAGENLSISAWFRVDGFDTNWQALIAHGEGADYRISRRSGEQTLSYAGGVGDIPGPGVGPNVADGQWHNVVAITEAGISTRLWIDGALVGTGGAPALANNGSANLLIGGNPDATGFRTWNGGIDDVGMWGRVLTPTEIMQIYTDGQMGIPLSAIVPEPGVGFLLLLAGVISTRRRHNLCSLRNSPPL